MAAHASRDPLETSSKYRTIKHLGNGAFGSVVLAESSDGQQVAIKLLKRSAMNKYVETEILNHSMLWHPHVIQFREVFLTADHVCIVMEYANSGSLFSHVQRNVRLPEAEARWYFQQIVLAVDYCHRKEIANRDIKLENTLLHREEGQGPTVKICDFGYSKSCMRSSARSRVGTITYMAPEVLRNMDNGQYNGMLADIWSCGVILYVMLYGRYPFDVPRSLAPTVHEINGLLDKMQQRAYPLTHNEVSCECLALLHRMLEPNPNHRISIQGILSDSWFLQGLPDEALSFNDAFLQLDAEEYPREQSVEQIREVVAQAPDSWGNQRRGLLM